MLYNLKQSVVCYSQYTELFLCSRCPPRAEIRLGHCFIALLSSCWSILSHSSKMHCLLIVFRKTV